MVGYGRRRRGKGLLLVVLAVGIGGDSGDVGLVLVVCVISKDSFFVLLR
jgi:hypothetical protein